MKKLTIGDLTLGEGLPKICVPLTGTSQEELLEEAELLEQLPCQIAEWRADYMLEPLEDKTVQEKAEHLKQVLGYLKIALEIPVIFTIRTAGEGGRAKISKKEYYFINKQIAESKAADVIDIQTFDGPETVDEASIRRFIDLAHESDTKVLLSSHEFGHTPDMEEMLARFFVMQDLGADLMKLAVMPKTQNDVFCLLETAMLMRDNYGEIPFIAVSMGELGAGTRICGGEFGSVLTFASGKEASAPGQMDAKVLHAYLVQYYRKDNRRQSKVSDDENDTN